MKLAWLVVTLTIGIRITQMLTVRVQFYYNTFLKRMIVNYCFKLLKNISMILIGVRALACFSGLHNYLMTTPQRSQSFARIVTATLLCSLFYLMSARVISAYDLQHKPA